MQHVTVSVQVASAYVSRRLDATVVLLVQPNNAMAQRHGTPKRVSWFRMMRRLHVPSARGAYHPA
ncbi:hypothetical protein A176_003861 [Myxococcus hansupus]|uniref:Uncharacterized protein n=1 Tax=Pseudomyxococcus hansupus TaxID=1297742 RepID=A0A0H4WVV0_9BACT|nr:hypothetical protein A176_003861 [Myxococcus hansupus]